MMKSFFLLGMLLMLQASTAQAQLVLHKETSPKQAKQYIRSILSRDAHYFKQLDSYVETHGAVYESDHGSKSLPGLTAVADGHTEYAWEFRGGDIFYSYIKAFRTDTKPPPLCSPDAPAERRLDIYECDSAIDKFVQCHLFIFDVDRKLVEVQPLAIPQPDYIEAKPSCYDVHAMAPAKVVKDGMLIVASYYDSRWTCQFGQFCASGDPLSFPEPLYKTTFLVRFDKDAEGKLILKQDDSCLGSLNNFSTIASARRALQKSGCK